MTGALPNTQEATPATKIGSTAKSAATTIDTTAKTAATRIDTTAAKGPAKGSAARPMIAEDGPSKAWLETRRTRAMVGKDDFNTVRIGLVMAIDSEGDSWHRFRSTLIEVATRCEEYDGAQSDVLEDEKLFNPLDRCVPFASGAPFDSMQFRSWARMLPPRDSITDAWYDGTMIGNIVNLEASDRRNDVYFAAPDDTSTWITRARDMDITLARLETAVRGARETGVVSADGDIFPFPAYDMSSDTTVVVVPYNTGAHWITTTIEPKLGNGQGKITVYNSDGHQITVVERVRKTITLFADLIGSRPGLDWSRDGWEIVSGATTMQRNHWDCGPITAANCQRLCRGQVLEVIPGERVDEYGVDLRYDAVVRLSKHFLHNAGTQPTHKTPSAAKAAPRRRPAAPSKSKPTTSREPAVPPKKSAAPPKQQFALDPSLAMLDDASLALPEDSSLFLPEETDHIYDAGQRSVYDSEDEDEPISDGDDDNEPGDDGEDETEAVGDWLRE